MREEVREYIARASSLFPRVAFDSSHNARYSNWKTAYSRTLGVSTSKGGCASLVAIPEETKLEQSVWSLGIIISMILLCQGSLWYS